MTDSEIREVFSGLSYRQDGRKCPNNRRHGQFCSAWKKAVDGEVYTKNALKTLTWNNLGWRMGQHFGFQSDEQIDEVFQVLADDYRSGVTPSAKKTASKATKKVGPQRHRSVGQKPKNQPQRNDFPDEIDENVSLPEGEKRQVTVNKYERNQKARDLCIKKYKAKCCICSFSFGDTYGEIAKDFIHVHHVKPLSERRTQYTVDPVKDLRPVCPNCHAVIHIRQEAPAFSIEEVEALLRRSGHTSPNRSPRRRAKS